MTKEKEQTLAEYFAEHLRPDIAERAIANHRAQGWVNGRAAEDWKKNQTKRNTIGLAFHWLLSSEGRDFWAREYDRCAKEEAVNG